jgi:sugar lactone lactonase YvrE
MSIDRSIDHYDGIRKALIIGISEYDDGSLEDLDFCEKDAREMAATLGQLDYRIMGYNDKILVGHVNHDVIRDAIIDFFTDPTTTAKDTLIFYYSGHGIPHTNGDCYLAASDLDPMSPFRNGFSFSDLTNMMNESVSTRIVAILDCCYSGAVKIGGKNDPDGAAKLARNFINDKSVKLHQQGEGKCLLAASQAHQEAYGLREEGHSIFTYYLLKGLKGNEKAVDKEGNVTPDSLSKYVYDEIMSLPEGKRPKQKPIRKVEASGDIILARYPELLPTNIPEQKDPSDNVTNNRDLDHTSSKQTYNRREARAHFSMLAQTNRLITRKILLPIIAVAMICSILVFSFVINDFIKSRAVIQQPPNGNSKPIPNKTNNSSFAIPQKNGTIFPIAVAGPDQIVNSSSVVKLNGSSSHVPGNNTNTNHKIKSYKWNQTAGNPKIKLDNANSYLASFVAPNVTSNTTFNFTLTVDDEEGQSANNSVAITVKPLSPKIKTPSSEISFVRLWGSKGRNNTQFNSPMGIAVDPQGTHVYVADTGNNRTQIFNSDGIFVNSTSSDGSPKGKFNSPMGIAVDPQGTHVYVADSHNNRILVFDNAGNLVRQWGPTTGTHIKYFDDPQGIAVDPQGTHVYVADTGNNSILVFDNNGTFVTKMGSTSPGNVSFNSPEDLAVDLQGHVYVADTENCRVQEFTFQVANNND